MIFDKIIEKVINKKIEELKNQIMEYFVGHKDEVIEKIKECALKYIDEHKDEVLNVVKDKIAELILHK